MSWPPYLMRVQLKNTRHNIGLWLPLFLTWPIVLAFLLAVFAILLPFALLAMLFTWGPGWWRPVVFGLPAILRLFGSLRGLTVDVERLDSRFLVIFR